MKIICFSKIDGELKMVLKGDSSLLNNQKPFFIPDWSEDVRMTPCIAIRVSRMGKNIGARFAGRYFDAIALALNIHAADYLVKGDWTRAWAFDFSLPIGPWMEIEANPWQDLVISVEDAIEMASQTMTIRQGDLLVIDRTVESRQLKNDEVIRVENNGKDLLYCKIK
jgi:2-keto-4-pentenoate hydratase/2-oxohepta-3-ene-1,7-dioic acid hydratase in catechol pathway